MSKGRNLTKRKWGDFRKSRKPSIDYKYPRRDIDKIDAPRLSMRCHINGYFGGISIN